MRYFDHDLTPILSSDEVAKIICRGIDAKHLALMPQGTLPEKVILYALQQEVAHLGPECIPEIEPLLRAPRPLFRTDWELLEVAEVEVDAAIDTPAFLSVVTYQNEALADREFGLCIGDLLPYLILNRISFRALDHLCLNVVDGHGCFACAEMTFWFKGTDEEVANRKPEIAEFLAEFIGSSQLDQAIELVTFPLERYRTALLSAQPAIPRI